MNPLRPFWLLLLVMLLVPSAASADRPNILWIVGEDASPHLGSYGEMSIKTPHLDALSRGGVRFTRAFVTCPVCSPSRSAMVTGLYQTTLGAQNHRSQNEKGKSGGNADYYKSYALPAEVKLIPQIFQEAGYATRLCSVKPGSRGKTDYNFVWDKRSYDGTDWTKIPKDKPFFT